MTSPDRQRLDAETESRAFRLLEAGRREEAAHCLLSLAESLESWGGEEKRLLLQDFLQRVLRRVQNPETNPADYAAARAALLPGLRKLALSDRPEQEFRQALSGLLERAASRDDIDTFNPLIRRARRFIDERFSQKLSLSDVAAHLHVSANYLSRLFRRETGSTLTSYIQRTRLEQAMLLLADGEKSISEIAYLVGYQNYRDFYRNFVKYEKVTPRQVRRELAPGAGSVPGESA